MTKKQLNKIESKWRWVCVSEWDWLCDNTTPCMTQITKSFTRFPRCYHMVGGDTNSWSLHQPSVQWNQTFIWINIHWSESLIDGRFSDYAKLFSFFFFSFRMKTLVNEKLLMKLQITRKKFHLGMFQKKNKDIFRGRPKSFFHKFFVEAFNKTFIVEAFIKTT